MYLYLHKAAKKLGIHPRLLKADVKHGRLQLNDDGCVDCEELKVLYPDQWEQAYKSNLDYYEGIKRTASQLSGGEVDFESKRLYHVIRTLEAENYALKKRVEDLERKLYNEVH